MKHFKDSNSYIIFGWMANKLGLKGTERVVYAIVYSFSQNVDGEYYGGHKYMADAASTSVDTVKRCLNSLVSKGLIEKKERSNDGVSCCRYSAFINEQGEGIFKEGANYPEGRGQNTPEGRGQNAPSIYNKDNNKDNNKENNNKEKSPEELEHDRWFAKYFPVLSKNKRPLKLKTYIALQANYTKDEILMKLNEMEAKSDFNRKYSDVGRVLLVWLKRDKERGYIKPKEKQNECTSK